MMQLHVDIGHVADLIFENAIDALMEYFEISFSVYDETLDSWHINEEHQAEMDPVCFVFVRAINNIENQVIEFMTCMGMSFSHAQTVIDEAQLKYGQRQASTDNFGYCHEKLKGIICQYYRTVDKEDRSKTHLLKAKIIESLPFMVANE